MKKILVSAILGLTAAISVNAQSYIQLYSYGTSSDIGNTHNNGNIVYGPFTDGTVGAAITGSYTVGFYWGFGNTVAAVNTAIGGASTAANQVNYSMTSSGLTLATGANGTATLGTDGAGIYDNGSVYIIDPSLSASAQTITVVLVAYNGSSYENSLGPGQYRGHSAAFTMTTAAGGAFAPLTGNFAGGFAVVNPIPEPSTFALAGLGLTSLLLFRRRK